MKMPNMVRDRAMAATCIQRSDPLWSSFLPITSVKRSPGLIDRLFRAADGMVQLMVWMMPRRMERPTK
jgi:hypothetical protein